MPVCQKELEVKPTSPTSHALQSRAYLDAGSLRNQYRKEQLGVETVQFIDNVAYLMWQAKRALCDFALC